MKVGRRGFALGICVVAVLVALLGGAARSSASTIEHCSAPDPSGRLFCVTIEDSDGVSPTGIVGTGKRQVDVLAYQFYKLKIANSGGNTLTNGTISVVLSDTVPTGSVNSSAVYVPSASASFCSLASSSPNTVKCSLANVAAGASTGTIVLGYRTSTTPAVTATTAAVTVGFKEGSNGGNGANPATLSFSETTSLEPDPEASVSWSPPGQSVRLGTSPTFDSQFSTMQYNVPPGKSPFVSTLSESSGYICAADISCFGELLTTDLKDAESGTFSASNLFHLTMTMSLDLVPGGNTSGIVVSHLRDNDTFEIVSRRCGSTPPSSSEQLPCITVTKDNKAKLLIVDVWGFENGGWMTGG